jgi:hypothetical protein
MRGKLSVAAALAAACWCTPATSSAALLINEVDSDTANVPSTDFAEFVELYDSSGGSVPLDGFVLIFYNGSNDRAYAGFDLDGFSTSATGYFVAGAVAGAQLAITSNTIQNGADSIALYQGDLSSFVTTNNTSATLITAPPAGPTPMAPTIPARCSSAVALWMNSAPRRIPRSGRTIRSGAIPTEAAMLGAR